MYARSDDCDDLVRHGMVLPLFRHISVSYVVDDSVDRGSVKLQTLQHRKPSAVQHVIHIATITIPLSKLSHINAFLPTTPHHITHTSILEISSKMHPHPSNATFKIAAEHLNITQTRSDSCTPHPEPSPPPSQIICCILRHNPPLYTPSHPPSTRTTPHTSHQRKTFRTERPLLDNIVLQTIQCLTYFNLA